ncbi:hypothetical protein [Salinibacter virus M31CR41-3]|nr:hypothetical protein [Salinibacter virus M31CR41-3]
MTLLGADYLDDGGDFVVALRIDNGQFAGKKVTHNLTAVRDPGQRGDFFDAVAMPTSVVTGGDPKKWLNDKAPTIRVSANVKKSIIRYFPEQDRWVEVDSPPREEAKFAVQYNLTDFRKPEADDELGMDQTFWERRQELESAT